LSVVRYFHPSLGFQQKQLSWVSLCLPYFDFAFFLRVI
jgi:hypothetical protein